MYTRAFTTFLVIFSTVCLSFWALPEFAASQQGVTFQIADVKTAMKPDGFTMTIAGDSTPQYASREAFDPYRIIVEIAGADFDPAVKIEELLPRNSYARLNVTSLKNQDPPSVQFEFTAANDTLSYDVMRVKNGLELSFTAAAVSMTAAPKTETPPANQEVELNAVPDQKVDLLEEQISAEEAAEKARDSFSISGYDNERISVDFYKIDLHNVFRLFRQVTDLNIIVDEAVEGSITLALTDVPWDFALDIILNLADLKKEEQHNTIVVYPKDKEFIWPSNAEDNLSFEADVEVVKEQALLIEESTNQPEEIMKAKETMLKAQKAEQKGDYEDAVALYEEAYELWPKNSKIANKIANLYLGRLNMSSRAQYFAKKSLERDPSDTKAALYYAISLANMEKVSEAMEYFNQSVSGTPPMKEALISYAAFCERNDKPDVALKLLGTYATNYGDTVHVMVSKARLLDKVGETDKATSQYREILTSGYQLRPDLRDYIRARITGGAATAN
ncbi:MAG: hypothetical protein D6B25_12885 [Desulfobulbaceae bacterium]|nr:MAG: hypothetical protein D6B25_12885 [Desulfobulbaceae bacterium]